MQRNELYEKEYIPHTIYYLFSADFRTIRKWTGCCTEAITVVIDAGHGGNDPGAIGKRGREKNINLNVALKLRTAHRKQL